MARTRMKNKRPRTTWDMYTQKIMDPRNLKIPRTEINGDWDWEGGLSRKIPFNKKCDRDARIVHMKTN